MPQDHLCAMPRLPREQLNTIEYLAFSAQAKSIGSVSSSGMHSSRGASGAAAAATAAAVESGVRTFHFRMRVSSYRQDTSTGDLELRTQVVAEY
jgi:hypothetical protein